MAIRAALARASEETRRYQVVGGAAAWVLALLAGLRTAWRRRDDDSALETVVRDREGRTICRSTAMVLATYWAGPAEIVQRAPAAARVGLTDRVLADGPPGRPDLVAAIQTAAALALILAAVVAMHHVWAQGSSTVARDLERGSSEREPRPR